MFLPLIADQAQFLLPLTVGRSLSVSRCLCPLAVMFLPLIFLPFAVGRHPWVGSAASVGPLAAGRSGADGSEGSGWVAGEARLVH